MALLAEGSAVSQPVGTQRVGWLLTSAFVSAIALLAGFTVEMMTHTYALVDAFIYRFALQEANLPPTGGAAMAALPQEITEQFLDGPCAYIAELNVHHGRRPGYRFTNEFGLDLFLNGPAAAADGTIIDNGMRTHASCRGRLV